MVVTKKVTSDAHAVELVAHTRVFEELRAGQHQYKIIMAAHILSGSSPSAAAGEPLAPRASKKPPMVVQQMLRKRELGMRTATPLS